MTVGGAAPLSGAQLIINIDAAIAALQHVLNSQYTDVGNVGGGTDDLMTYSLPANTLDVNGKGIRITAWGTSANNANVKTIQLVFGSVIMTTTVASNSVRRWWLDAVIIRTGSNAQKYCAKADGDGVDDMESGTLTQTDTAAITIKCTGAATTTNDIVQEGMLVEALR